MACRGVEVTPPSSSFLLRLHDGHRADLSEIQAFGLALLNHRLVGDCCCVAP